MAKFFTPNEKLEIKTKKGELSLESSEYFKISEENRSDCLMISKQGISKIEDFFEIEALAPQIQQTWVNNSNFNIVITVEVKSEYGNSYGCASANPLNLKGDISRAYPVELGVKRARATAILELLRKNYVGEEPLALLYSTFDEFKAENSINNAVSESKKHNEDKVENKVENKNNSNNDSSDSKFKELCFTKKYPDGISLIDIYNNDREYFKQMSEKPNKYRNLAIEYLNSLGVAV